MFTIPNDADCAYTVTVGGVTFAPQAAPDKVDVEILAAALGGSGWASGAAVTAQGTPDGTVAVAAGVVMVAGTKATVAGGNVNVLSGAGSTPADATNPRFDLICASNAGALSVVVGTAAAAPAFPAIPANNVVLAAIYIPATDTTIQANQIVDKRAPTGAYVPYALADAAGDIFQGSGADTIERVAKGLAGQVWRIKADGSKGEWASGQFKRVVRNGAGNISTTSTSRTPIDSTNLPYQTIAGCQVGDVLEVMLALVSYSSGGAYVCFDFEVDQPTSANVYVGSANDRGVAALFGSNGPYPYVIRATFVVTEAGDHGVRPVWFVTASTGNIYNAASGDGDNLVAFTVENRGAPA